MLSIKILLNNLMYINNFKKLSANLMNPKSQKDNLKFALFTALVNATYKALLCALRRLIKDDRVNTLVASVMAALWISMEPKNRRILLTVLLLSRSIDISTRMAVNHQVVYEYKHFNVFAWLMISLVQQYVCAYEKDCLNPSHWRLLQKWSAFTENDLQMQSMVYRHTN